MRVIQKGNPILRKKAQVVLPNEFSSEKIKKVIKAMSNTLAKYPEGVALAAPQIGESIRLFIVSGKLSAITSDKYSQEKNEYDTKKFPDEIFINPEIIKSSSKKVELEEGCMSVEGIYGKIKRAEKVTIKAQDENGDTFQRGASGLLAEIYQHEIDHLNGILFVDSAKNLKEIARGENKL